jgi:hypothetical protein
MSSMQTGRPLDSTRFFLGTPASSDRPPRFGRRDLQQDPRPLLQPSGWQSKELGLPWHMPRLGACPPAASEPTS